MKKDSKEKLVKTYIQDCYEEYRRQITADMETEETIRLAILSPALPSTCFFCGTA